MLTIHQLSDSKVNNIKVESFLMPKQEMSDRGILLGRNNLLFNTSCDKIFFEGAPSVNG